VAAWHGLTSQLLAPFSQLFLLLGPAGGLAADALQLFDHKDIHIHVMAAAARHRGGVCRLRKSAAID
jgi:hypothetical protein